MESLAAKRARLRRDLQKAYGEWMAVSEAPQTAAGNAVDTAAGPHPASAQWSAYLAAKARLVAANAEQQAVAS